MMVFNQVRAIGTVNSFTNLRYTCTREEAFLFSVQRVPADDAATTPTRRGSIGPRGGVVGLMLIVTSSLRPSRELTFVDAIIPSGALNAEEATKCLKRARKHG